MLLAYYKFPCRNDDDESIFGEVVSNETTLHGLLKNELGLFCHLVVKLEDYRLPLT